uniref:Uncharacterized protein n=1 Tax=Acrobeloides nanus TaxID=290746 RepID=A0A914CX00_9BILA
MHSITATQNYIILPVTSILFNPCDSPANPNATIQAPDLNGMVFFENVGIRFLIFDKRNKSFITQTPLETKSAMYVTHQLNAYEINDDLLVADMIPYPNDGPYSEYMYRDFLLANGWLAGVGATRFSLDLSQKQINVKSLIPQPNISIEFPQINHTYQTKNYSWGYIVQNPYTAGNSILKINVNDPSGKQNLVYKAKNTMVVHEPQFLARPDAVDEDDGVLIIRGQDVESEKGKI